MFLAKYKKTRINPEATLTRDFLISSEIEAQYNKSMVLNSLEISLIRISFLQNSCPFSWATCNMNKTKMRLYVMFKRKPSRFNQEVSKSGSG